MRRPCILTLLAALVLSGCSLSFLAAPLHRPLDGGAALPPDAVLVIGKVLFDPPIQQGYIETGGLRPLARGMVRFLATHDLSQPDPADDKAIRFFTSDEMVDISYERPSFIPMPAGTRYLRVGGMTIDIRYTGRVYVMRMPGGGYAGEPEREILHLYLIRPVKIDIPAHARAVYIGTLVYTHDGKKATDVEVRDEYAAALHELAAKKIPGITPQDVVKSLAVPL